MTLMRDNTLKSVKISPASYVMLSAVIFLLTDMNRDQLQNDYIESIIDGMDHKTMYQYVYDNLADHLDKYSVDELITEVEDYYPELLEESEEPSEATGWQ